MSTKTQIVEASETAKALERIQTEMQHFIEAAESQQQALGFGVNREQTVKRLAFGIHIIAVCMDMEKDFVEYFREIVL